MRRRAAAFLALTIFRAYAVLMAMRSAFRGTITTFSGGCSDHARHASVS